MNERLKKILRFIRAIGLKHKNPGWPFLQVVPVKSKYYNLYKLRKRK